jgi:hypothetical protein
MREEKAATMSDDILKRLERLEAMLVVLVDRAAVHEWYSTNEFAQLVGKAEFTVREWCRLGRIRAEKKDSGRGAYASWAISHSELLRFQGDGLLPLMLQRASHRRGTGVVCRRDRHQDLVNESVTEGGDAVSTLRCTWVGSPD